MGGLVRRSPVTCPRATRIAEAARLMDAEEVGSVVVLADDGAPIGILTDRDLRGKVVAGGVPPSEPVTRVMSAPLHTLRPETPALDALLEMLRRGIRHFPLVAGGDGPGRLVGVVSSYDFLALRDAHPVPLLREIERRARVEELAELAPRATAVVRALVEDSVPAADIARITAEVNDGLVRRVLGIVTARLRDEGQGDAPLPYCWLALGSEGRREQTLRTDQDNALVYEPRPEVPGPAAERYFERLAAETVEGLIRCGVPRCPADVMASNPRWRQPLEAWQGLFSSWIRKSAPQDLLFASIFFDFRPIHGDPSLAGRLGEHLRGEVAASRGFLRLMAWTAVSTAPPLGLFGRFVTPWRGRERGRLNLKLQGTLALVNAVRVHALELGVTETNSLERLESAAAADGRFTADQVAEVRAAYDVITRLRLRQQLADLDGGRPPTSAVAPGDLNRADRAALKEAFRAVGRLQDDLRGRFVTDLVYG